MNRPTRLPSAFSKVSVKSRTVIPREVRQQLGLTPGDTPRYRVTDAGVGCGLPSAVRRPLKKL
jgi:bifunctional DNA-binding transcriptional regulator/antitoxin component of YhaV-PrlF toxin-antitoxin module